MVSSSVFRQMPELNPNTVSNNNTTTTTTTTKGSVEIMLRDESNHSIRAFLDLLYGGDVPITETPSPALGLLKKYQCSALLNTYQLKLKTAVSRGAINPVLVFISAAELNDVEFCEHAIRHASAWKSKQATSASSSKWLKGKNKNSTTNTRKVPLNEAIPDMAPLDPTGWSLDTFEKIPLLYLAALLRSTRISGYNVKIVSTGEGVAREFTRLMQTS